MQNRIDAVYARQSIDKADSISIDSQIEFCKYELKGGSCKEYTDKGFSGKNTDRPQFQQLVRDIEAGLIARVIVYKLDRISRSIIDFAGMIELFQQHDVEFVSSTEKFDTSTPMGRAMLNICIVFAQLERETIQKRIADAYHSRSQKGLYMGGKTPAGFRLEPFVLDGVRTKKLVPDPEQAALVKLLFEMYAEPRTSYGDIVRFLNANETKLYNRKLTRSTLSSIFKNLIYVRADLEVYEFLKSQGAEVVNDAADFAGTNGCYTFTGKDAAEPRYKTLNGHTVVLAPSEGIVSSELWLKCRRKLLSHDSYQQSRKVRSTWLKGKARCGNCGYSLDVMKQKNYRAYFRCQRRCQCLDCVGCGTLRVADLEEFVYGEMVKKLADFQTLRARRKDAAANPKLTALKVELARAESEIGALMDSLTGANAVLLSYANAKITELDDRKQSLVKQVAEASAEAVSPDRLERVSGYLGNWENVSFDDKRLVIDTLITRIAATSERVEIQWKI